MTLLAALVSPVLNISRRHCWVLKPSETHIDISKIYSQKDVTFAQTRIFQIFLINLEECSLVFSFYLISFFLLFLCKGVVFVFKNFSECRQSEGIVKAIT